MAQPNNKQETANANGSPKSKFRGSKKSRNKSSRNDDNAKLRKEKFNDPSWYVANPQVMKDVASLSFNNALGARSIIASNRYDGDLILDDLEYTAPGIMTLLMAPAMGVSDGSSSPLSVASKNYYSWIRHWNSGHVNYDSPDLMMYFGAMDSIYSLISTMTRAYGVARVFSHTNRYIGDALLSRMGFNPLELRANLADFRGFINMYITKVQAFCVPSTMTLYKRHFWMYSGVYKDSDVVKSQMYMYVPAVFWKYNEVSGAGRLDAIPGFAKVDSSVNEIYYQAKTLPQVYALANEMLSAIVASEDINIMSGDVLKAYGKENLWNLAMVPEDYAVFPEYSEEVLTQIHNTTFAGCKPCNTTSLTTIPPVSLDGLSVYQDPEVGEGALFFMPQFINASQLNYNAVVDILKEDPTPEDVIVATRNICGGKCSKIEGQVTDITKLTTCGSDIALYANIASLQANGNLRIAELFKERNSIPGNALSALSQFNQYPRYLQMNTSGAALALWGELDNYTVISHDDIERMHQSAILSMLGVPFLGTGYRA